jgi:hypothetical protein
MLKCGLLPQFWEMGGTSFFFSQPYLQMLVCLKKYSLRFDLQLIFLGTLTVFRVFRIPLVVIAFLYFIYYYFSLLAAQKQQTMDNTTIYHDAIIIQEDFVSYSLLDMYVGTVLTIVFFLAIDVNHAIQETKTCKRILPQIKEATTVDHIIKKAREKREMLYPKPNGSINESGQGSVTTTDLGFAMATAQTREEEGSVNVQTTSGENELQSLADFEFSPKTDNIMLRVTRPVYSRYEEDLV